VALVTTLITAGIPPVIALTVNALAAAPAAPAAPAALPPSTQFDIDGFLQTATLDGLGSGAHQGGHLTVNGQVVTVPAETIVILPANALTWAELFTGAPAPYAAVTMTGMALADFPLPPYTYEVHVVGNRVGDTYIAGLIDIAQNGLNGGAGYINYIDYATGEFRVGGTIGSSTTGARVQLNDPLGRFGRAGSPDPRFTVDADNPTIAAATGFPMCIPRTDPAVAIDALCPESNRIVDLLAGGFVISQMMADPSTQPGPDGILGTADDILYAGGLLDPRLQVPMEIGDYVNFSGTLINDAGGSYVSAHTVGNNMAIYTVAGTNPAYVSIEVGLIGTGGLTVIGAGEAAIRTKFEGMTTDYTRNIHLYGMDMNPADGSITERDWGTIAVDPGAAGGLGAVQGRWRFRPPCLAFGSVATVRDCVYGPAGIFLPPTREVRAVIEGLQTQVPSPTALTSANGIYYGQYHAPIGEYIFPENIPGTPIVPNNFESIPFLACGGYTSAGGTIAAGLNPWPGALAPVCAGALTVPVANAGVDQTAASGASVSMTGTATGNPAPTVLWTQAIADVPQVVLTNATTLTASFTAPNVLVPTTLNFTLTATNNQGTSTDAMIVTVNPVGNPTVNHVTPITVTSGNNGGFEVSGSDPNLPVPLTPLTFHVTQAGLPALISLTDPAVNHLCAPLVAGTSCATVSFQAPVVAVPTVIQVAITATNTAGAVSATENTSVTVNPVADLPVITNAEYRTGKQRLIITASDLPFNANVVLTLQRYPTLAGGFYPALVTDPLPGVMTSGGGGLYNLTMVGVPQPAAGAVLQVKSNLGGVSPLHALDRIRA
jgi:hypothetical protein